MPKDSFVATLYVWVFHGCHDHSALAGHNFACYKWLSFGVNDDMRPETSVVLNATINDIEYRTGRVSGTVNHACVSCWIALA